MLPVRQTPTSWLLIYDCWAWTTKGVIVLTVAGAVWTFCILGWISYTAGFRPLAVGEVLALTVPIFAGVLFGARRFLRFIGRRREQLLADEKVGRYKRMFDEAASSEDRQLYARLLAETGAAVNAQPAYRAEFLGRDGPSPQNYRWAIWRGSTLVAEYGHDFRNDERWLVVHGVTKPILEDVDLLSGGGSEPLIVSEPGVRFLDKMLEETST